MAMKFYVTEQDRKRARALSKEIDEAQKALWDLIAEARSSGAHASLGFPTWNAYAEQTLDTARIRLSAVNAALEGRETQHFKGMASPRSREIVEFIREHPGCTVVDIQRALLIKEFAGSLVTRLRNAGIVKYEGKVGRAARLWLTEDGAG